MPKDENSESRLPEQYRFSHDYCLFLYDILVEILKSGEKARIFANVEIEFKDAEQAQAFEDASPKDEALFQWLENNGFDADLDWFTYKHAIVALLADYCQFMLAALRCSEKGNLTVAFALLRKPLRENLFLFEWLLHDSKDFITTFRKTGADALDERIRKKKGKLELMHAITTKIKHGSRFNADLMYRLRYEATETHGFERVWNQATHLVTTFKDMETETHNFNFIFSGEKQRISQWNLIYLRLPVLLDYTVDVVEALVATLAKRESEDSMDMRRLAGMYLWAKKFVDKELGVTTSALKTKSHCDQCHTDSEIEDEDMEVLYEYGTIPCPNCLAV